MEALQTLAQLCARGPTFFDRRTGTRRPSTEPFPLFVPLGSWALRTRSAARSRGANVSNSLMEMSRSRPTRNGQDRAKRSHLSHFS